MKAVPTEDELLHRVGSHVCLLQATEGLMNLAMTWVLRDPSVMSVDALAALQVKNRKRTIGQFVTEMKKHFELSEDFESLLSSYLEDRNHLIHHFYSDPKHSFQTEEGRMAFAVFLDGLHFKNWNVMRVFAAFIEAWGRQTNIGVSVRKASPHFYETEFFKDIDQNLIPKLGSLITGEKKKDPEA